MGGYSALWLLMLKGQTISTYSTGYVCIVLDQFQAAMLHLLWTSLKTYYNNTQLFKG